MATCSGGQLQCPEVEQSTGFPAFEADQCWTCIDPDQMHGDYEAAGCGSGCIDCLDDPNDLAGYKANKGGRRFLRPARTGQTRNAEGFHSDLISDVPERVPRNIIYERAACWQNQGRECFQDLCKCEPQLEQDTAGGGCVDKYGRFTAVGDLLPGEFHDCVGVIDQPGSSWPKQDNGAYDCRHVVDDHFAMQVALQSGFLIEPIFFRDHACGANAMILATARIANSSCGSAYINRLPTQCPGCLYYGDGYVGPATRARFDTMHIVGNTARLNETNIGSPSRLATLQLKNEVLNYVGSGVFPGGGNFGALENLVVVFQNAGLGYWRRDFNERDQIDPALFPVVAQINALSKETGITTPVTVRIRKVACEVYLYVLRLNVGERNDKQEQWWPYARCRIRAWTSVHGLPAGTGQAFYFRNDVPFAVPGMVEWRGSLGFYSNPPSRNILPWDTGRNAPDYGCVGQVHVRGLLHRLSQSVGGFPAGYIPAMDGTGSVGAVTFNFGLGC